MAIKNRVYLFPAFFIFYFSLFSTDSRAGMAVQACFSPSGRCSSHILRAIGEARNEILVAVYAFTSDDIAWALVKAGQRRVKVQVIVDQEFDGENRTSKGSFLERKGLAVRRISGLKNGADKGGGLMHQKFAVIDRSVVLTGSYNWTASAEKLNHENLLVFRDAGGLAEEYRNEFFRLWGRKR